MAWSQSGYFSAVVADLLGNTTAMDFNTDTHKVSLFPNSITPNFAAAAASTAYNTGVWTSGSEVTGTNWPAGGIALVSPTITAESPAAGQVKLDANDVSVGSVTVSNARGCLLYDDTITTPVADQGWLGVNFGADFSASGGTFAITWHANGIGYFDVW